MLAICLASRPATSILILVDRNWVVIDLVLAPDRICDQNCLCLGKDEDAM